MQFVSEDVASRVVSMAEAIGVIERMFREYGRDEAEVFPVAQGHGPDAGTSFSIKSGLIRTSRTVGLKVGSYWPQNRTHGLPAHASTTLLLDPDTGYPQALVAASHLTCLRTAASDAVAVRHLSRQDSRTLALFGAGHQAWFELLAVREVRPIETVLVVNRSPKAGEDFARRIQAELGLEARFADSREAVQAADIIVTVTAAREALFEASLVRPGTHVSAMGADAPGKQELDPALVARAALFADVVRQSLGIGEYEAAHKAGLVDAQNVTAIGAVLNGAPGRTSPQQITVYDSSGMALQDMAICSLALAKAHEAGLVRTV
ncbi:ornithine cyclodeaminase family protein [Desulfomicrobium baculatum]|uniref:Ornithine cyclodeaminase n=1 Tax=Desulfomicrobium baculatum (strain DSM 4028 / VKM B-1378 / X) TaxID=525897 RepID=C7LRA4_DESBD|nr:ornithine cyclodeaminase family protein [Desulfomicrobium baculatum]ACU89250.1 Ornithine cyclodeaminase [Desulfomicrobium baculatum DSM 4028]